MTISAATPSATNSTPVAECCSVMVGRSLSRVRASYSAEAKGLLNELGIDTQEILQSLQPEVLLQAWHRCLFRQGNIWRRPPAHRHEHHALAEFLAESPLPDAVQKDIARVYTEKVDYLKGLSQQQKIAQLRKISYAEYLTKYCKLSPEALPFFQTFTHDLYCVGIEAVPAYECYEAGDDYGSFTYAGFDGLGLPPHEKEEPYIFHFPDGNASIARLLVRSLIPAAIPGSTMEDVVTAKADYSQLDRRGESDTAAPQHHGRQRQARDRQPARRKEVHVTYTCGREALPREREQLRASLLQRDDSLHLPGIAGGAEGSALLFGKGAACLHACRHPQLDSIF